MAPLMGRSAPYRRIKLARYWCSIQSRVSERCTKVSLLAEIFRAVPGVAKSVLILLRPFQGLSAALQYYNTGRLLIAVILQTIISCAYQAVEVAAASC